MLNPFLEVLRSTAPISIPLQTLEGALGHFFATLKDDQLITLTQDVLNSTSLWRALGSDGVKKALRYAPGAKVAALRPNTKDTFFKRNQLDKAAQKWLSEVLGAIANAKPPANAPTLYLGLLEGLDDVPDVKWGRARTELEEEVVVAVSEKFEKSGKEAVMYYCEAAKHVKPARLRVLNLKVGHGRFMC